MREKMMMRDMPQADRPRERMVREGADVLSNQELLAIVLQSGVKNESVLQLAQRLINHFGGLNTLSEASIEELQKVKGIGEAKAALIAACIEFGRRMVRPAAVQRYTIRSPEDGANYVMEDMRFLAQEHFVVL